jgi:succinate dehydrogenase / fumarate reductase flavoprotein subunit
MYDEIGLSRSGKGLNEALGKVENLKDEFWNKATFPTDDGFNKYLEIAGRAADFIELAELMAKDALDRDESAGCHLREEHQSEEGEAIRDDDNFAYVSAWEWKGEDDDHELHKENLVFENVKLVKRNYK